MIATAEVRTFNKAEFAELSISEITDISEEELTQLIRAVSLPFVRDEVEDRLEYLDREPLERLAYLARRCCRNQRYKKRTGFYNKPGFCDRHKSAQTRAVS